MSERRTTGGRVALSARRFADRAYNRLRRAVDPALSLAQRIRNSTRWKKLRVAYKLEHPMCELCRAAGRLVPAREVDHVVPLEKAPELGLKWTNLQALCRGCHALKSQAERRPPSSADADPAALPGTPAP